MTNLPQKEEMRQAINDYCKVKGISKNQLATQADVSSASLSKIENRKWNDIDEKLFRKIWNTVSESNTPDLFNTNDFAAASKTCETAQKHHYMIGIIADTGVGKTTALMAYSLRPNVFYVVYDKTFKPKQFFVSLLREMGISFEGSLHDMVNRIADEINTMSSPLIIIDESGKITHSMIMYLQVLRDKTIKNCGIVLSGMPYFKSTLIKNSTKQKEGYAEFYRRINLWQTLEGLRRAEITYICHSYGITDEETLREMYGKKRFGDLENAITFYKLDQNEVS